MACRLVPADLRAGLTRAHSNVAKEVEQVEAILDRFDSTLKAALVKSGAKIQYQLDKITKKVEREIFRRDQQATRAAERLTNAIYRINICRSACTQSCRFWRSMARI